MQNYNEYECNSYFLEKLELVNKRSKLHLILELFKTK